MTPWLDYLNINWYREVYQDNEEVLEYSEEDFLKFVKGEKLKSIENLEEDCIELEDDNYIVFSKIDSDGFGRRP